MCQLCALALRHQKFTKQDSRLLNPKSLSVLVTLNPKPHKFDESSASNNQQSPPSN